MKVWAIALAVGVLATAAHAAETPNVAPGFSVKGEGRWQMLCHVLADGENQTVILESGRTSYSNAKMTRSECDYRAGSAGDLLISVVGVEACPFAGAAPEACTMTAPKGKAGSFKFQSRKAR